MKMAWRIDVVMCGNGIRAPKSSILQKEKKPNGRWQKQLFVNGGEGRVE